MSLLDKALLNDLGIELSEQDYDSLAEHFDDTLQKRVIAEIVEELSVEHAEELATMQNTSEEQLQTWLTINVPSLREIVSDEIDILLGELAENTEAFTSDQTN
jgi:hypothetical protein